jgi:hypothetical protein
VLCLQFGFALVRSDHLTFSDRLHHLLLSSTTLPGLVAGNANPADTANRRGGRRGRNLGASDLVVRSLEISDLAFGFFPSNPVALLYSPDELIALTLRDLSVIVGQLTPLFLGLADKLFPVSLQLVGVHLAPPLRC